MELPAGIGDALDALYSGPPEEFVAGRDRLAKQVRTAGHQDLAVQIRGLRRPTLAAWALNQVAREQPDIVVEFVDVSRTLRGLQEKGDDADALRHAIVAHREVRRAVADAASGALAKQGTKADATHEEIAATLDAAALDEEVAATLVAGRLERAAAAGSAFQLLASSSDFAPSQRAAAGRVKRDARLLAASARVEEATRSVDEAQEALDHADADVQDAQRALEHSQSARDEATRPGRLRSG